MINSTWPPPYQIKRHPRAKHVKLRAVPKQGLLITVPTRFKLTEIPSILNENQQWIIKQLAMLKQPQQVCLPEEIFFRSMNVRYRVSYLASSNKLELITRPQQEISLTGKVDDTEHCYAMLTKWSRLIAKDFLSHLLQQISSETVLPYKQLTIRDQKSLWGSCTHEKSINLNYKLIFLPIALARHVIIHELCHTRFLNHSDRFWQLVAKYDYHWQQHRRELRKADQYIPDWLKT